MENNNTKKSIDLELTIDEANIVIVALRELPHRVVADLINKIMNQVKATEPSAFSAPVFVQQ